MTFCNSTITEHLLCGRSCALGTPSLGPWSPQRLGRHTGKQLSIVKSHDVTVKMISLWFCAITELRVCGPEYLFYTLGKEGPKRWCQMSKSTQSHEGFLWLFRTWQYRPNYASLPQQRWLRSEGREESGNQER